MNDILNFKSITTYRLKLPLKFNFKTAKGEVKERETIVIHRGSTRLCRLWGMRSFHRALLYSRNCRYMLAKISG